MQTRLISLSGRTLLLPNKQKTKQQQKETGKTARKKPTNILKRKLQVLKTT